MEKIRKSNIEDRIEETVKKQELAVANVLGAQVIDLLHKAGVQNLQVDKDGQISGETNEVYVYPTTTSLSNIHLALENGNIMIRAVITGNCENTGSVI